MYMVKEQMGTLVDELVFDCLIYMQNDNGFDHHHVLSPNKAEELCLPLIDYSNVLHKHVFFSFKKVQQNAYHKHVQ